MSAPAVLALVLALNLAAPVAASPLEDGRAAYQRGDYAAALVILRPLAKQGDVGALHDLGFMYSSGRGVTENEAEAFYWLSLSADLGNADAQSWLGAAYFGGWGTSRDMAKSARWYRSAADQGDAEAMAELGALYENGFGVPQDYVEAMKWSILAITKYKVSEVESRRLATVNRDRQAKKLSATQMAEAGKRARQWTPKPFSPLSADLFRDADTALQRDDHAVAARLFGLLANRGDPGAQTIFGAMYGAGKGVPRNSALAVKWFRLAAKQGEAGGQYALGSAYERGAGTTQDLVRAHMWYSLAAASGDSYAARFAQNRDKIASKMSAAQISQARAMAQKCKASNFKSCD